MASLNDCPPGLSPSSDESDAESDFSEDQCPWLHEKGDEFDKAILKGKKCLDQKLYPAAMEIFLAEALNHVECECPKGEKRQAQAFYYILRCHNLKGEYEMVVKKFKKISMEKPTALDIQLYRQAGIAYFALRNLVMTVYIAVYGLMMCHDDRIMLKLLENCKKINGESVNYMSKNIHRFVDESISKVEQIVSEEYHEEINEDCEKSLEIIESEEEEEQEEEKDEPSKNTSCYFKSCGNGRARKSDFIACTLSCGDNCVLNYHFHCWKKMKKESAKNDKEFLNTICLTPDCGKTVVKVEIIREDGQTKIIEIPKPVETQKNTSHDKANKQGLSRRAKKNLKKIAAKNEREKSVDRTSVTSETTSTASDPAKPSTSKADTTGGSHGPPTPSKNASIRVASPVRPSESKTPPIKPIMFDPSQEPVAILKSHRTENVEEPQMKNKKEKHKKKQQKTTQAMSLQDFLVTDGAMGGIGPYIQPVIDDAKLKNQMTKLRNDFKNEILEIVDPRRYSEIMTGTARLADELRERLENILSCTPSDIFYDVIEQQNELFIVDDLALPSARHLSQTVEASTRKMEQNLEDDVSWAGDLSKDGKTDKCDLQKLSEELDREKTLSYQLLEKVQVSKHEKTKVILLAERLHSNYVTMLRHQLTFAHSQEKMVKEAVKHSKPPVKNYLMEHLVQLSNYITTLEKCQREFSDASVPRHLLPQMTLPDIPQIPELPPLQMPDYPETQEAAPASGGTAPISQLFPMAPPPVPPPKPSIEAIFSSVRAIHPDVDMNEIFNMMVKLKNETRSFSGMSFDTIIQSISANIERKYATQRSEIEGMECAICSERLGSAQLYKCSGCSNSLHFNCMKAWVDKNKSCPFCRKLTLLPDEYPSL